MIDMKYFIAFLLVLLCVGKAYCQQYRLVYDKDALPELYERVGVTAQEQKGNGYVTLQPGKYKLTTTDADYRNGTLGIDRNKVQQSKGVVNFNLSVQGKSIPVQLQLPVLKGIRYNLYTDSIKPVLNYYVNIEGEFTSGKILPLDAGWVSITADHGSINGMEWIPPAELNFEKVTFTATVKTAPKISIKKTVYLKKYADPRDAYDYKDATEDEVIRNKRRR
ncbi:MAG: hypothetical protein EOP51_10175 [Sphingobacteriales bacterium]|nr:MAG: hypothetical protein EOP51_10175 [Sphingobacteriales bacterium]